MSLILTNPYITPRQSFKTLTQIHTQPKLFVNKNLRLIGSPRLVQLREDRRRVQERRGVTRAFVVSLSVDEVHATLDGESLRVNRDRLVSWKLPEITKKTYTAPEMVERLRAVLGSLNLADPSQADFLSAHLIDDTPPTEGGAANKSAFEARIQPEIIGKLKTAWDIPLESGERRGWMMYDEQKESFKKAISHIFEQMATADSETRMMLCVQLFSGLIHCPTGQKEAIDVLIRALVRQNLNEASGIRGKMDLLFALLKNDTFQLAVSPGGDHTQNVHIVSHYHSQLKDILGLSSGLGDFRERIGTLGYDPHYGSEGNALLAFHQFFTPDCLIDALLTNTQIKQDFAIQEEGRTLIKQITKEESETQKAALRVQLAASKAKWSRVKSDRPITPLEFYNDLETRGLLAQEDDWKKYFSSDPSEPEFFELTREGAKRYLTAIGVLIVTQPAVS